MVVLPCLDFVLFEAVCDVFLALLEWLVLDFEEVDFVELDLAELDFVELVVVVAIAGVIASSATRTNPNCG